MILVVRLSSEVSDESESDSLGVVFCGKLFKFVAFCRSGGRMYTDVAFLSTCLSRS